METLSVRVIVDYQNVHLTGHDTFAPLGLPKHESLVHPLRFAEQWLAVRNHVLHTRAIAGAGAPTLYQLDSVAVYRGAPSNKENPTAYRRSQAQRSEWTRDRRVQVTYRTLTYRWDSRLQSDVIQEKGIDVMVALDFVGSANRRAADVVVLASHDSDMEPALAEALTAPGVQIETAGWQGCRVLRAPGSKVWHTQLGAAAFVNSRDRRDYT